MINITHKSSTLRKAIAQATVRVSSQATIDAVVNKQVAKGDVFEMAKTAGLFAAKRTADMIPDCHPLPIEFTAVRFEIQGLEIHIQVEVHTIYKTGVEVEAMHAASVVALTAYDMLKPIDKGIEIHQIKLLQKSGGKSDFRETFDRQLNAAVLVCSEPVVSGKKEDLAGQTIKKKLESAGLAIADYHLMADDEQQVQAKVLEEIENGCDIVILSGGTGLTKKDRIPEIIKPILEKEVPGIEQAIRAYGLARTPHAMISRTLAGMIGDSLVLVLPGSSRGAEESMDALFPAVLHIFKSVKL
ncbi:bifunctional molybdenum cofactor biosynthesis protein MoaC/MoaB [Rhodonellum sp.]|uniref:bifunctional molybdenum cofactor biosynthesis protein MoaC/MoaB n=1 Tax=Rhodonellum sp. TaxID=2231180 RepID=UPI0027221DA7|nr:bifunctional molybdenum cofactor biosynthesis protein MoaC/MoaB [Rhodonellum sp.]MDO9553455.1 bifunctional molybdenum cofactor biosynthesis protein MoaC/MoaB [Rhodonellum sp.]